MRFGDIINVNKHAYAIRLWKHQQQQKCMNTWHVTNSAKQAVQYSKSPQQVRVKRLQTKEINTHVGLQFHTVMTWIEGELQDALELTCWCPAVSLPHVPASKRVSGPQPSRNSFLVCCASKKAWFSITKNEFPQHSWRTWIRALLNKTHCAPLYILSFALQSCAHVEKSQSFLLSCFVFPAFFVKGLLEHEERGAGVCVQSSVMYSVCVREREMEGRGGVACVRIYAWMTYFIAFALLDVGRTALVLVASVSRSIQGPLGMSDVLIQWPVSCSCVHITTEPLEPAVSQHSGFIFTPNLMQNIKAIFRSFSHSVTFKHIFHPSSHSFNVFTVFLLSLRC